MRLSWASLFGVMFCTLVCAVSLGAAAFGGSNDRVLLREVSVLTLKDGIMTAGRRSSPVPQLSCVGGTARGYFTPKVVQCYNRGSDGYDIQWECKADMDNSYRFGSVEVTCEGYEYPDDPYILRGSCGLEFTLDFTEEGSQRNSQQKSHNYGRQSNDHSSHYGSTWGQKGKSGMGDMLFLGGVALVIYLIYKTCLSGNANAAPANGSQNDAHRPRPDTGSGAPPPYGFRPDYMPGGDSCSGGNAYNSGSGTYNNTGAHARANTNQGGGFWTGAATGGLMGYLFGRNTGYGGHTQYQQPYGGGYQRPGFFSGWGSGRTSYGGNSFGSGSTSGRSSGSGGGGGATFSSGTRTASGFGGTKRR